MCSHYTHMHTMASGHISLLIGHSNILVSYGQKLGMSKEAKLSDEFPQY